jgi:hypothetical protein
MIIPIPEGFNTEGRDSGEPFEMTITGHIADGKLHIDAVEGVAVEDEPEEAEAPDVEMDEEALAMAVQGGPAA